MESEETVKEAEPAVKEEENTSTAAAGEQTKSVDAGEKRKRSRSPEGDRRRDSPSHKRERRDVSQSSMECRDWVESHTQWLHHQTQSFGGFGYMWGGLRANYGVTDGKVAFQMKLGEYPKSWGYGGTAKFSTNSKFSDFNVKYYNTDVVTCYLDMTGDNVIMSFAKNDQPMAKAAEFPKSDLDGEALFPAIATKNQLVEVNFGQLVSIHSVLVSVGFLLEKPWVPLLGDEGEYTFIGKVPVEERVRAAKPPLSKEECEVLLLIGLPGAGKSHWAVRTQRELPEKRYYVLGTNNIIDRMKVEGVPRKNNYAGRWDVLFDQANDCLRKMLETATRRYKNYILDQTNVYDTAQRRKMRPFVGFKRKAVVVLPTDKVYRERITKRTKEEGKEVPETAVLEMKANFSLPTAPIETVLNPEANELAAKEAEEERLAKEKKQLEEKEAAAEKSEAAEKAEAGESEQVESAMEEGEEKKEEAEVKTEAAVPETKEEETEEKASADAVETEKVKEEVEKMDETSSEQTAGAAESEPAAAEEKDTVAVLVFLATESEKAAEGDSKPSADSKETEAKTEEKKEEPEQAMVAVVDTAEETDMVAVVDITRTGGMTTEIEADTVEVVDTRVVVTEGVMAVAGEDKAVAGTTEGVGVAEEEVTAGEETTTVEVTVVAVEEDMVAAVTAVAEDTVTMDTEVNIIAAVVEAAVETGVVGADLAPRGIKAADMGVDITITPVGVEATSSWGENSLRISTESAVKQSRPDIMYSPFILIQ
ncbi:HNRNPU [Bugula neritina]|uniref:HNRNPU n=1 Tax=Bugula neritina TaxID=10212 RepID=A0A7J7KHB6_BUGNE|nr:HNRNPU [Bugula neritina]